MSDNPEETAFYQRIIVMYIDLGTETLLKVFKYAVPQNDVAGFLTSPETKSKLFALYKDKILNKAEYNTVTVNSPDPEKFDITLLVRLLINLFGDQLPKPILGWYLKPQPKDYSLGADLLRLRNIRNKLIAHTSKARLSKEDFERLWCKIEEVLLRVSKKVEPDSSVEIELRKYKEAPLDPTKDTYSEKVRAWKENIEWILQQVEDLRKPEQEFQIYFKTPPERYIRYIKLLFDGGSLVMCSILKRELDRSNTELESCLREKEEALLTRVESEQLRGQLFPPSDPKEWDIWLLSIVIPILFGSQISQAEKDKIAVIRSARENYAEAALSSLDMDHNLSIWMDLTSSLNKLSQNIDEKTARKVETLIQKYQKRDQNIDIDALLDRLRVSAVSVKTLEDIYEERLNELSKWLGKMNEEGITLKKPYVFELKLEILCGDEEKKHAAEQTLEKECQIKFIGFETPTQVTPIWQEADRFIRNIKNIPGVQIEYVSKKCILLGIRCSSTYGSHKFISYVLSKRFQTCLQNIRNELCHMYTEPMDVLGNLTFESIYEVLNDPCSTRDIESASGINIPITCSTAEGVQQVLALLRNEDTTNSLNQIADQLSQQVDTTVSLKVFPLLNEFESVIGETDSENSGSGSGYLSNEEEAEDRSASLERKSEDTDVVSKTGTSPETDQFAAMSDKYHRLVTLVVDICPRPLRELLITKAKADGCTGVPFTTLDAYLQARKSKVDSLLKKSQIRIDQYAMIYPFYGSVDVNTWDVSLLAILLTELFWKQLCTSEIKCINDIRNTRNTLQHIASCHNLDDKDYNKHWGVLERSVKSLATTAGSGLLRNLSSDINEVMNGHTSNLGDVLRTWYLELTVEELRQQVMGLEEKVEQLQENDGQLRNKIDLLRQENDHLQGKVEQNTKLQKNVGQLQNTIHRRNYEFKNYKPETHKLITFQDTFSVERKGRSGIAEKRIKAIDLAVEKMKDFEQMLDPLDSELILRQKPQGTRLSSKYQMGKSKTSTLHPSVTDISKPVPGVYNQHVWSVVSKQNYNIKMAGERSCYINGLCQLQTGEFLLADFNNKRLKKLDAGYRVIGVCDVPGRPWDVCYIGNNEAVVALYNSTLQFVDVTGMTLTRSVSTEHACRALTCHGDQLYVIGHNNVYMYSTRGIKQRVLYTHTDYSMFSIVMSDDGSKMYIACYDELVTIDSSGNLLSTFSDPELGVAVGVCVDGEGHVLVGDWSGRILQISSDGKHKLGTITDISEHKEFPQAIYFDRHKSVLTCAGRSENVVVLQLK